MFRKSFAMIMALMLVVFVTGCGGNKDNAPKADADKPAYSADKAILGYAEMYVLGLTDHLKETGLSADEAKKYSDKINGDMTTAFSEFPLSKDNVDKMVKDYVGVVAKAMDIKTELVKDDPENPVVKLSIKTIKENGADEMVADNEFLVALGTLMGTLQAQGLSIEDMKTNDEFQKSAVELISKFMSNIPLNAETSMEVTCKKEKGADGKVYWAPQDTAAVEAFVQPK